MVTVLGTSKQILFSGFLCLLLHGIARTVDPLLGFSLAHLGFALISVWISWQISKLFVMRKRVDPNNKLVLITGCDTGFGNKLAATLDEAGFTVLAACLDPEGNGARSLTSNCSERLKVIKLDVTLDGSLSEAFETVKKLLRANPKTSLWGIVNNAGIGHYAGIDWNASGIEEIYVPQLDVNTLGTVRVTRKFLPLLRKTPNSRVVIVSSMSGRFVFPGLTGYSMSKFAVRAFGDGLRRELYADGIHVAVIEPVMYDTPITDTVTCLSNLSDHWNRTTEEVKESVGSSRFDSLFDTVHNFLLMKRKNINEVVNTVKDCLQLDEPASYYQVGGFQEKLALYLLYFLPEEIQDFFLGETLYKHALKLVRCAR